MRYTVKRETRMKHYKIVFSDIDGTLLDSRQNISRRTQQSILEITRHGIPFILVSGRMPHSVLNIQKKLGITAPFISYSGALMRDEAGKTIWNKPMSLKTAVALRKRIAVLFPNIISYTFSADRWITDKDDGTAALYLEKDTTEMPPLIGLPQDVLTNQAPVHKILCFGEEKTIDALQIQLRKEFPFCSISKSLPQYLEIMSCEASKSAAASFFCQREKISHEDVIAFGDNYNDADLLEYAGTGVAMGNAPDPVKQKADIIAPANDEDGVFFILQRLRSQFFIH